MKRAEIDRLRTDLQKTEEKLDTAEMQLEKQIGIVNELNR